MKALLPAYLGFGAVLAVRIYHRAVDGLRGWGQGMEFVDYAVCAVLAAVTVLVWPVAFPAFFALTSPKRRGHYANPANDWRFPGRNR